MEKMFEEGVGSTGGLDLATFLKAMKKIMSNVSDEMLEAIFLKMDSDCDGFVTWQKYVDYVMREFYGKELMRKSQYRLRFHLPMRIVPLHHGCEIVKVQFLIQRFKKMGHFLTITKDGILEFWSESFFRISSFRLNQMQQHQNQQMWVIDMVCLYNLNLMAIASSDQKIEFFDISNRKCERAFTFTDLDSCALVMDYWSDYHRGVFCFGDTQGNVVVFTSDNVIHGLFNPCILPGASKWEDHWIKVPVQKLLNEKSALHRSYKLKALHPNWCQQIKFIPQLNLVASCSAIEKSSLVLTILPSTPTENLKSSALNLRRGVLCFEYLPDKNFLVTGGYDPIIRLWNPFSKRPVWLLKGHQTSVMHILVDCKNYSILLSVSKDKNIRVWDMQDYICLQSFSGKLFDLGNCPITSTYFHKNNTLICSTYSIGILKGYLESQGPQKAGEPATHSAPLCAILYSKIFKQVVSGSLKGMVSVWDIVTGRRMMQFSVVNAQNVELTAMALDESERCLLTGLRDGTITMWNYNIGDCLLTFPKHDQLEISGIIHMNKVFYVTGWSKRITYFMFHKIKPVLSCFHCPIFHSEDVLSMAKYQNQFLGTSSYNGDILFWNVSWLKPILNFNASKSPLPSQPRRVEETEGYLSSRCFMTEEKWAYRQPHKLSGSSARTVANASLRQNLVSAPPVMRHSRENESDRLWPEQKPLSAGGSRKPSIRYVRQSVPGEAEKIKKCSRKKTVLQYSTASVEKIIFLQTRPRLPQTAALLSSCIDGYIYAWSIHGNGGLLGKFPVDIQDNGDVVVGAMATDKKDWLLITGDCQGHIKIWDIKDYCTLTNHQPTQASGEEAISEADNKVQVLIPELQRRSGLSEYVPLMESKVVAGQTISLVPPKLLNSWKGHLDSVTDILFVDIFQLVISASQDWNVKAWKLSGDAVGTFGLNVWRRLQDPWRDGDVKQEATLADKADSSDAIKKPSKPTLQEERDLAEVLAYQRREQVALMSLLYGKADVEAEAWAKVQKMALMSPWAGKHSLEDIESSWLKWESKGKLVSKVLGAAYKYKERSRSPEFLSTNVQYAWMKYQISPQIYQNLHFSDLKPTQQLDFSTIHRVPDEKVRRIRMVTRNVQKGLEGNREQAGLDAAAIMPAAPSTPSSLLSLSVSASRFLDSSSSTSPRLQSSFSSLRPGSASMAHSIPLVPSQVSEYILQRSVTPKPLIPSLRHHSGLVSSGKRSSHVKF
ncbi:EF-hand calcium-binding domain-containing protein 8 isoform X1 [Tamandua tetradactyla]|uniref:EF-hand calcium-binding domain-containing protein 8 isoform X1 n=2 Tax=Tamandua tetradactyla TaxID=48850 RepID=UPI004053B734